VGIDADIRWNSEGSFRKDELRDLKAGFVLANLIMPIMTSKRKRAFIAQIDHARKGITSPPRRSSSQRSAHHAIMRTRSSQ
jgi:hypothetical protein